MVARSAGRGLVAVVLVCACGPSVQEQELRDLRETLRAMQAQVARLDERVEKLSHRVAVLGEAPAPARAASFERAPELEVVRLAPRPAPAPEAEAAPDDDAGGPVVEIKVDGSTGVPSIAVVGVPPPPAAAGRRAEADALFQKGLAAYQEGRPAEAYGYFQTFVRDHPRHEHADNAQYWMGECQLELGRVDVAITELARVLERYPRSAKAPDALMKLGAAYERQGKGDLARRSFQKVIDGYPNSALAELARARLTTSDPGARSQR